MAQSEHESEVNLISVFRGERVGLSYSSPITR